jgi:hypothetical protein
MATGIPKEKRQFHQQERQDSKAEPAQVEKE